MVTYDERLFLYGNHPHLPLCHLLLLSSLYEPEDDGPKGFGGYGTVYRYRKRDTGEIVAVKTFTPRATRDDPEPLLRREVNILRDLSHPNIIALKDPTLYHEVDRYGMDIYRFVIECMDEELYEFLHVGDMP